MHFDSLRCDKLIPDTRLSTPSAPSKWLESVRGGSGMSMVMHEKGSAVWHKCWICITLHLVLLVFTPPAVHGRFMLLIHLSIHLSI
jgi:hypothetical protein